MALMDRNKTIIVVAAIVCATVFAIALFIWPTPYSYQKKTRYIGNARGEYIVRINRFTGNAAVVHETQ